LKLHGEPVYGPPGRARLRTRRMRAPGIGITIRGAIRGYDMSFKTKMASLASYDKGSIELNDDLRHYAFSNIFEVCSKSKPYERVMVASNLEYAAEAVRA